MCPQECHDIPNNSGADNVPDKRMCLEEVFSSMNLIQSNDANSEGYEWVPHGLTGSQVYCAVFVYVGKVLGSDVGFTK